MNKLVLLLLILLIQALATFNYDVGSTGDIVDGSTGDVPVEEIPPVDGSTGTTDDIPTDDGLTGDVVTTTDGDTGEVTPTTGSSGKTTPVSLYDRVWDVDYVTLQKGGIRQSFMSYLADLRLTSYTFDLSAYPMISRVILYTSHRTDLLQDLSFKVNGVDVSEDLVNIGQCNGNCWQGKPFIAYRLEKFYDCVSSPTEFAITDIPTNAILDGFSLVVIYNDGDNTNNRDLTILNGNDVNFATGSFISWNADVFVNPVGADDVSVDLHVADVEWRSSEYMGSIYVNGVEVSSKDNPIPIPTPKFIDSEYWAVATYPVTGLTAGAINTVTGSWSTFVPTENGKDAKSTQDCQSLIAVVVSTPTWQP